MLETSAMAKEKAFSVGGAFFGATPRKLGEHHSHQWKPDRRG